MSGSKTQPDQVEKKQLNKFTMIKALADRARKLEFGAPPLVEKRGHSLINLAMSEIAQGKLLIHTIETKPPAPIVKTTDKEETQ